MEPPALPPPPLPKVVLFLFDGAHFHFGGICRMLEIEKNHPCALSWVTALCGPEETRDSGTLKPSSPHSGDIGETSSVQPRGMPSLRGVLRELLVDERFSAAFSFSRRSSQKLFANMDPLKHGLNADDWIWI